jgi:hypothetical protein
MSLPEPPSFRPSESGADPFVLAEGPPPLERRQIPPRLPGRREEGRPVLCGVANGLLFGAMVEGILSFLGCFPWVVRGVPGFGILVSGVGWVVTVLFVWELFLISSYRRLPWVELWGLLGVILWSRFLFLPLPGLFEWENLEFMGSLLMVGTALGTAGVLRQRRGVPWLAGVGFEKATSSWGRSAIALALKLGVGVPVLVGYVAYSVCWMVDWRTNGFLRVDRRGISVEARSYGREKESKRVHLLPTAHIGTDGFYERLMRGVPEQGAVLLPEGVTDSKGVLSARWSYSGPARVAGLREQPDFSQAWKGVPVQYCDVDLSELSAPTQQLLSRFSGFLQRWSEGDWLGGVDLLSEVQAGSTGTVSDSMFGGGPLWVGSKVNPAVGRLIMKEIWRLGMRG